MKTSKKVKEPKTLGERIRFLRGDLTQSEFADILRIKQAMVSRYEADKETPSPRVLLRVAQFCGRSMEWLLTGDENITASSGDAAVKRLGAKTSKQLSRDDQVEIAAGYLKDTHIPEAEDFVKLMSECFQDRKRIKKLLDYYKYLRFEENDEPGK